MDWTDHYYYNSNWQVLEVRRDTGSGEDADPREQYVWHPYYIDALATRFFDATMGGTQMQHYFTHDANFNVTAVLSDAGAVVERYHYTPYGELTVLDADFSDDSGGVSDMENPYTFTGRRFDGESGLYQYRNRYYGAEVGRFVTRDPIGYAERANLYEYSRSNPANRVDAYGKLSVLGLCGYLQGNCDLGEFARQVDGYAPNPNGCSIPEFWMDRQGWGDDRNCPTGGAKFETVCNAHDNCYDNCWVSQASCDLTFASDLLARCQEAQNNPDLQCEEFDLGQCNRIAAQIAFAVSIGATDEWNDAQRDSCECL